MVLLAGPLIHRGREKEAEVDCNQLWNHFILFLRLSDYDAVSDSPFVQKKSSSLFCRAPVEAYFIYLIGKEEVLSATLASDFSN